MSKQWKNFFRAWYPRRQTNKLVYERTSIEQLWSPWKNNSNKAEWSVPNTKKSVAYICWLISGFPDLHFMEIIAFLILLFFSQSIEIVKKSYKNSTLLLKREFIWICTRQSYAKYRPKRPLEAHESKYLPLRCQRLNHRSSIDCFS